ncbi:alpha/beta hydrolase [Streptomyces sp. NPDC058486]|uniref:alpha/beta hydrolase n=1 Tax=unclassified Streptomyces TaxID=2593676 RepID=UPI003660164A
MCTVRGVTATQEVSGLLDQELIESERRQPFVSFADPLRARRNFRRATSLSRGLRGPAPDEGDVTVEDTELDIFDDGRKIPVRIYIPAGGGTTESEFRNPPPVLLYMHGGAFVAGDLDTEHDRCLRFSRAVGCAVVSIDYRRPPEHPFPAPLEDCYAVLLHVAELAERRGWDGTRVAVGGSSAGGNLAAGLALMARDRSGPAITLQLLLYPALDDRLTSKSFQRFVRASGWDVEDSPLMWRHYLGDAPETHVYAAPARCDDFHGLAPAYVLVAEVDALRDEGIDYACRMMRDGVPVELHCFAGAFHGFDLAAPQAALTRRALADQTAALKAAFARPGLPHPARAEG